MTTSRNADITEFRETSKKDQKVKRGSQSSLDGTNDVKTVRRNKPHDSDSACDSDQWLQVTGSLAHRQCYQAVSSSSTRTRTLRYKTPSAEEQHVSILPPPRTERLWSRVQELTFLYFLFWCMYWMAFWRSSTWSWKTRGFLTERGMNGRSVCCRLTDVTSPRQRTLTRESVCCSPTLQNMGDKANGDRVLFFLFLDKLQTQQFCLWLFFILLFELQTNCESRSCKVKLVNKK